MTPTAPFALTVTVSIGCAQSGCDAHHEYPKVWVYQGHPMPAPDRLPPGWSTVNGFPVCPKRFVLVSQKMLEE